MNLETGSISIDETNKRGEIKKVHWLILNYKVKESIKITTIDETYHGRNARDSQEKYKSKGILVVNSLNIRPFFSKLRPGTKF